jgi:hypothetical protein
MDLHKGRAESLTASAVERLGREDQLGVGAPHVIEPVIVTFEHHYDLAKLLDGSVEWHPNGKKLAFRAQVFARVHVSEKLTVGNEHGGVFGGVAVRFASETCQPGPSLQIVGRGLFDCRPKTFRELGAVNVPVRENLDLPVGVISPGVTVVSCNPARYRHGGLIRDAIKQAAASNETDRDALTEQRASLGKEISRTEHAIDGYQDAFEAGNLNPARFTERLSSLDARLDSLRGQDQALARDLAADTPPDTGRWAGSHCGC